MSNKETYVFNRSIDWLRHELISSLNGQDIPLEVAERIYNLLPSEKDKDSLNVIFAKEETSISLTNALLLYDKMYESRLHKYGVKEELLYAYHPVTPGLCKYHKFRNNRGKFTTQSEIIEPGKISNNESNIFLIKKTEWDSFASSDITESYIILIYDHNNIIEQAYKDKLKLDAKAFVDNENEKLKKERSEKNNGNEN